MTGDRHRVAEPISIGKANLEEIWLMTGRACEPICKLMPFAHSAPPLRLVVRTRSNAAALYQESTNPSRAKAVPLA